MSRSSNQLPVTGRAIALILSSNSSIQDAQPGVIHQLLDFAHRYTAQVLTDASVYSEHASRSGKIEIEDVALAVQARVGWEFGSRVPKEHTLALANSVNSIPLPPVPEVFGVRLPSQPVPSSSSRTMVNNTTSDVLTSPDFNLLPNKPPPEVTLFEEYEEEEFEEDEDEIQMDEDEEDDMEAAPIPQDPMENTPFPISAIATDEDMSRNQTGQDEEEDEDDGLFAGGDEEEGSDGMEEVQTNGTKRKLVEEDDYD